MIINMSAFCVTGSKEPQSWQKFSNVCQGICYFDNNIILISFKPIAAGLSNIQFSLVDSFHLNSTTNKTLSKLDNLQQ